MLSDELKTIFESVDRDILSEETLTALTTLVEETVTRKVDAQTTLEMENVIKTQYDKFKVASDRALSMIDEDHTKKIKLESKPLSKILRKNSPLSMKDTRK